MGVGVSIRFISVQVSFFGAPFGSYKFRFRFIAGSV